uniref:tRNA N6-adenosine threonylcarbamoyltransferase n=1 Tax=uncultured marine group II/III euryarchaeote KM3_149_F06 TaxID=1457885 RepID=A0A075GHX8_9EURY|nr:O-sialoglycoprotein endopeptidase (KAE1, OSGEP) [uncultured marine group II/III euryarchaeote KM3_149_F06]
MVIVLGIECTAHTFGVGVSRNRRILSNVRDMYKPTKGGIIPIESAKHHKDVSEFVYEDSLNKAKISEKDISVIAFSNAPGLAPCLIEGMKFAKMKAEALDVPLVPVNHCIAHLEIGKSRGAKDPILLYASGANTQIISLVSGKYRVFGETLDSGIGNFIDTFARHVGIPFPGGPEIEKKAKSGKYIELPYSIKGMDVSFSGMLTKLKRLYDSGKKLEDLSFSLQETAFAMLVESAERALAHTEKNELVLGGGVACNQRLQEMCRIMCKERGAKFFCPAKEFLVDNGAMIAYTGELMFARGIKIFPKDFGKIDIAPRERTDEVEVKWK